MKITKILFEKRYNGERLSIPISDIPNELLVSGNDIMINVNQGDYGSNGWVEGETYLRISQYREQTEEEKQQFRNHLENLKKERTEKRRLEYLKLKKEFEND